MEQPVLIPIANIQDNPYQHRDQEDPDAVAELAISIFRNTLQQYPAVRAVNSHYELVFGHTRRAAFRLLATEGVPSEGIQADKSYLQMPVFIRELSDRQMFELAVVENLKRRDPKPTEKARAIDKYITEFKATSKEAGDLFNMNESTVRGMVRFLDLPQAAQTALDEGRITQGTARALLSMQKIASKETITTLVKQIEQRAGESLPEDVMEHSLERLDNVVELWDDDQRNGKPRAGYHGWPLDMKKFPNQLLPRMSEQQAGAVESQLEHLVNPPACSVCPFYTKIRGTHYCGMKFCHQRKSVAWEAHLVDQASKHLNIAIYDKEEDGAYVLLVGYESSHKKIFTSKNAGLRLLPKSMADRYASQWGFDGLDEDHVLVVATGKAMDKLSTTGRNRSKGGKKTDKEKAEMRMMRVYRVRRLELLWEFTACAKSVFDAVPYEMLLKIHHWKFIGVDDNPPAEVIIADNAKVDDIKKEYFRRLLIWQMVIGDSSHYRRESMADILKDLDEHAKEWGVKIPKSLTKKAQDWDAEIEAVAVATKGKTS